MAFETNKHLIMAKFEKAFKKTLAREGGYVNDADDRGGRTYKGIAENYWPNWEGWPLIDELISEVKTPGLEVELKKKVEDFYYENFWKPLNLDHTLFTDELAEELFDTAVNQGLRTAGKYLQKALNFLNNDENIFSNIAEDGAIGPQTLNALQKYKATGSWTSRNHFVVEKTLLKMVNHLQMKRYIDIVENNESQEKFLFGWMARVD
jgi:lysozyme family protein